MLFMAGFVQISCVEEVLQTGKEAPTGEGYLSLGIDMGNLPVSTRAYGDEDRGTVEEMKIYDIRIVLYDGLDSSSGSCKVEYVFDLDIHTPDEWTGAGATGWLTGTDLHGNPSLDGNKLKFVTKPLIVADKTYKMLVLINGKDIMLTSSQSFYSLTEKGSFLHEFNAARKLIVNSDNGTVNNGKGFFMSNHQGLVPVTKAQLGKTDGDAVVDPVSVYVARMVAKVRVKHDSQFSYPQGFDANSATWGLAVSNKKAHWMRKALAGESSSSSMLDLYAEDPNYSSDNIDMEDNFNNLLFQDNGAVKVLSANVGNTMNNYEYLLENTISAATTAETAKYLDQATHVVVGYKYTPKGYAAGDSYYIFDKQIISTADMNYYSTGGNIPQSLAGLKQVIQSIQSIHSTNPGKYPLDGTSTEYYEIGGLRFCPKGQVYYYFPIRHFVGAAGSLGYYGVVRNNIYEVTIRSLNAPENDDDYLSAEITIMPWNLREQSNTVGVSVVETKWAPVKVYHYYNYKEANLYNLWAGNPYEYQTVMVRVERTIYGTELKLENEFKTYLQSPYNVLYYTYSAPNSLTVSENANDNVMELFYTATYASAIFIAPLDMCFIKEDGTVLKIIGKEDGFPLVENPHQYSVQLITAAGDFNGDNYIFIKHLSDFYELEITDNYNQKYRITTQANCVKYYTITSTPITAGKLNNISDPAMPEPVKVGSGRHVLGGRGVAIICEPIP